MDIMEFIARDPIADQAESWGWPAVCDTTESLDMDGQR